MTSLIRKSRIHVAYRDWRLGNTEPNSRTLAVLRAWDEFLSTSSAETLMEAAPLFDRMIELSE